MINVLIAAALATALPGAPPAPAKSDPALFVVRDADTTVYVFGTFHALDGHTNWLRDEIRGAFDQSDELVLETLIPEGPPSPNSGFSAAAGQRLRNLSVTPSASFLATTHMAINAGRAQGMRVDNGADMVLRRDAEAQGKTVEGLETLESQLNMFSRMPSAAPAAPKPGTPVAQASPMVSLSNAMAEMQSAWKRGDQSVFVRMLGQLNQASPDTYRMMFVERNARWADWIAARMQTPGTVFVAVGAGHLAGKDSLLVRLAEHGIESTRLN